MLIINADDWGRSVAETNAALRCYEEARITSASAMVFMADSERAAERKELRRSLLNGKRLGWIRMDDDDIELLRDGLRGVR